MSNENILNKYDTQSYMQYTYKAEVDKAIHTLEGIVKGISIDNIIVESELKELREWCNTYNEYLGSHPFSEMIPLINKCIEDDYLDDEEQKDILWLCNNYKSSSLYYNIITSDLQRLQGIFHGIMADNKITDTEVLQLRKWINDNDHLTGCYPYDEINSLLTSILSDGYISPEEKDMLKVFFSEFIDTRSSLNIDETEIEKLKRDIQISGICSVCPDIEIENRHFCFTGNSTKRTRKEIETIVQEAGGLFFNTLSKKINYLIVGDGGNPCWAFACYGRKVEKAINLRKTGHGILIVHENDFWDTIEDLY